MHPYKLALSALALASGLNLPTQAASHREAPLIAQDPVADITDVYAFVSYDESLGPAVQPPRVTLIMNSWPGQNPADGPNYFSFGDDVTYRLNIDNNQDGKADDIVYEFRFKTENRPLDGKNGISDTPLAFIALPPITALNGPGSEGIMRRQTYTVTEIRGGQRTQLFADKTLVAVPSNAGPRTMPNYEALAAQGIYSGSCAGGTMRVFAGQRKETFYIDLGAAFDTLNFRTTQDRPLPLLTAAEDANDSANPFGVNRFAKTNVNSIALEIPVACLTRDHQSVNSANSLIGLYASTSRNKVQVLRTNGGPIASSPQVQVQRMGNPLVNELIINTPSKDFWNTQEPEQEAQFQSFYKEPVIAAALELVFGPDVPATPRTDLMAALLKYPGQLLSGTNCGSPCSELLRLDMSVSPTAANEQRRLGSLLTPDKAGWPNGRRPNDDITDIVVRVVGGANYALAGDGVNAVLDAPGAGISDGPGYGSVQGNHLDVTINGIAKEFPFLPSPHDGLNTTP